jgi:hypothetical protein
MIQKEAVRIKKKDLAEHSSRLEKGKQVVCCPSQQSLVVDHANYQLSPPSDFPHLPGGGEVFAFGVSTKPIE